MAHTISFHCDTLDQVTALLQHSLTVGVKAVQVKPDDQVNYDQYPDRSQSLAYNQYRNLDHFTTNLENPEEYLCRSLLDFNRCYLGNTEEPLPAIELLDGIDWKVVAQKLLADWGYRAKWALDYLTNRLQDRVSHRRQLACGMIEFLPRLGRSHSHQNYPRLAEVLSQLESLADCFSNDMISEIFCWWSHQDIVAVLGRTELPVAFRFRPAEATDCPELAGCFREIYTSAQ